MTSRSISSNLRSTSRLSKRSEVTLSNGSVHPSHMDRDPLIASILEAPILMKGDYPYLIHPLSDGVPRIEPELLDATLDRIEAVIDWTNVDLLLGIEAMGVASVRSYGLATTDPSGHCPQASIRSGR